MQTTAPQTKPGLYLPLSPILPDLPPTTPDLLAAPDDGWAADVAAFGPWERTTLAGRSGPLEFLRADSDRTVFICAECGSTMDLAWKLAEEGILPEWGSVLAARQTAGRGQLRREWISPPGNLHVSLLLPRRLAASPAGALLPVVLGWMCAEALEEEGVPLRIKWPNDLLLEGRKVGGMLVEDRGERTLAGIGLNLRHAPPDDALRAQHAAPAGTLEAKKRGSTPLVTWLPLVKRLQKVYESSVQELVPPEIISLATDKLAWMGRRVRIVEGGNTPYTAVLLGLAPDGGLIVGRDGEEETIHSGSILPG